MTPQPIGGTQGQAVDIDIHAREILHMADELVKIMAKHTGQSVKKVKQDSDRDYFMGAEEAQVYGIIDKVLTHRPAETETKPKTA